MLVRVRGPEFGASVLYHRQGYSPVQAPEWAACLQHPAELTASRLQNLGLLKHATARGARLASPFVGVRED